MPVACGSDRLEIGENGSLLLFCGVSKGWLGRRPKTLTSPEYPGTAVQWEDKVYEVLEADPMPTGGARYRLRPWEETHAIRVLQQYDEASEVLRTGERRDTISRERKRWLSTLLGLLAGHLPGSVQERMEREYGYPATWMTILSALPLFAIGIVSLFGSLATAFGASAGGQAGGLLSFFWSLPFPVGYYLFAESALRLAIAATQSRPAGSLLGWFAYEIWRRVKQKVPAIRTEKGP